MKAEFGGTVSSFTVRFTFKDLSREDQYWLIWDVLEQSGINRALSEHPDETAHAQMLIVKRLATFQGEPKC